MYANVGCAVCVEWKGAKGRYLHVSLFSRVLEYVIIVMMSIVVVVVIVDYYKLCPYL